MNSLVLPGSSNYFPAQVLAANYEDVDTPKEAQKMINAAELRGSGGGRSNPALKQQPRNQVSGVYYRLKSQAASDITEKRAGNEKVTFQELKNAFSDLQGEGVSSNSLNDFNVSLHPEEELARRG